MLEPLGAFLDAHGLGEVRAFRGLVHLLIADPAQSMCGDFVAQLPIRRDRLRMTLQRARHLAVNMAIVHQARVDVRLHMLLWHLAARWGRVRSDGVVLPLRLTHSVLADLAAARRPTVTSALSELARRDLISPLEGGWLLLGDPPGELQELSPVPTSLKPGS